MKPNLKSSIFAVALLVGGFIGASALAVLADSTWTGAPDCSTLGMPCLNKSAPINVGTAAQTKAGDLAVNAFVASWKSFFAQNVTIGTTTATATISIVDGNQGTGKVLTSDINGKAKWVATSSLGINGSVSTAFGSWLLKNQNTPYIAATDGFVVVIANDCGTNCPLMRGFTSTSTITWSNGYYSAGAVIDGGSGGFTMPVRKGDYWMAAWAPGDNSGITVHWLPVGQ